MTYHARLTEDDMIQVPAELRDALGVVPGDTLVIEREGDHFVIKSREQVLREIQAPFRALKESGFTVDQFLAERREDMGD